MDTPATPCADPLAALAFELDRAGPLALHRQLHGRLRALIAAGVLRPGMRIPSSRAFAEIHGVARNTVLSAFDQLVCEGYLEGRHGSGTYVAPNLPSDTARILLAATEGAPATGPPPLPSRRGQALRAVPRSFRIAQLPVPFRMNYPAVDAFPVHLWAAITARIFRRLAADPRQSLLGEGDAQGYPPLCAAIADHLELTRGVRCRAENVVIFAGAQQALDVAVRVLIDEGDAAWLEDPSYPGARSALLAGGAVICAVPVDAEGLNVAEGEATSPCARLAYVCPSQQFPLGVTMSLARRLQLLDWAQRHRAWIIEDDYDSEYRFAGRPVPALQGLDRSGSVIYLGTFSKVLFPSLRLGYAVVPDALIPTFVGARAVAGRHSPVLEQATVATFITEGHLARHKRRMRNLYAERKIALLDAAHRYLGEQISLKPTDIGLQVIGWLAEPGDDASLSAAAKKIGIELAPLSRFTLARRLPPGVLFGFGGFPPAEIEAAMRRLTEGLLPSGRVLHH